MSSPLEKLAEMVRQAEAKAVAQQLGGKARQAAERLRAADERAQCAQQKAQEVRPERLRELERIEIDEKNLNDLIKKAAQFKTYLQSDNDVAELIRTSREDLQRRRTEARAELEAIAKELAEARRELQTAQEQYHHLRRELDRLQPQLASEFSEDDRLARTTESYFPSGRIHGLSREIDDGALHFGSLDRAEQYAQLKIWIGRFRQLQDQWQAGELTEVSEEDLAVLERIHPKLVAISREHQPGYIEAFRREYTTDWELYVAEAQDELRRVSEMVRQRREMERRRQEQQTQQQEQQQQARESAQTALEQLKAVIARYHLPEEGADEFHEALAQVIAGFGTSDPELLRLVRPFEELLEGDDFRALRRNLRRAEEQQERDEGIQALQEQYRDLLAETQGRRAMMVGGVVREDARRSLEQTFDFDELDWRPYEDSSPVQLDAMEQRVRNRGVDLVLILRDFVGHHVTERLRPLCEQQGIPCLIVDRGYGASQIAEALRRGLLKAV